MLNKRTNKWKNIWLRIQSISSAPIVYFCLRRSIHHSIIWLSLIYPFPLWFSELCYSTDAFLRWFITVRAITHAHTWYVTNSKLNHIAYVIRKRHSPALPSTHSNTKPNIEMRYIVHYICFIELIVLLVLIILLLLLLFCTHANSHIACEFKDDNGNDMEKQ